MNNRALVTTQFHRDQVVHVLPESSWVVLHIFSSDKLFFSLEFASRQSDATCRVDPHNYVSPYFPGTSLNSQLRHLSGIYHCGSLSLFLCTVKLEARPSRYRSRVPLQRPHLVTMLISAAFPIGSTKQCTAKTFVFLFLIKFYFRVRSVQTLSRLFWPRTVAQIPVSNGRNFLEIRRNFYFKANRVLEM